MIFQINSLSSLPCMRSGLQHLFFFHEMFYKCSTNVSRVGFLIKSVWQILAEKKKKSTNVKILEVECEVN